MDDVFFMEEALRQARLAYDMGEVPVGACAVYEGEIIARGYNLTENNQCSLDHAELIVLRRASEYLGTWRLNGITIYSTLEPCSMCSGALVNTRVDRLVFGAWDKKRGCCGSLINLVDDPAFNHRVEIRGGVLEEKCLSLIQAFFKDLRKG